MTRMAPHGSPVPGQVPRAVLLDALGTLVELEAPWAAIERELAARGAAVPAQDAHRALAAEMRFYREHHHEAGDERSLERLRDRCTEVLRDNLPPPARDLPPPELRAALLAALRFRAYPDAVPALDALRGAGTRLAIVSNWDVSLHDVLRRSGLAGRVDVVVTSAEEGVAKPDPAIFRRALDRLGGIPAAAAVHVGDDPDADVAGARGAGIGAVLIDRAPGAARGPGVIGSLSELPARLAASAQALP
jgi:putative hydrolase of the HAD superfamily